MKKEFKQEKRFSGVKKKDQKRGEIFSSYENQKMNMIQERGGRGSKVVPRMK